MPDGYRYPGSLVVRVLVNKFYALQRKYRREAAKPGRLAPLQAWFFEWEGAVVGGLIAGGLVTLGVKLYVVERLDDIERRGERCQWYEGSCGMVGGHLAAIQNSVSFWESLAAAAQHQATLRQPWQQQQHRRSQAAAQQLALWCTVCKALQAAGLQLWQDMALLSRQKAAGLQVWQDMAQLSRQKVRMLQQWVPEVVEELDYELTSQQYIQTLEAAAEAAMAADDEAAEQQAACWQD
ncbi:hypothetical protein OEZ86_004509 [Tetradesmus obliquus]|nr:hypothetical protein OEZ86_004509 [Tetradesmus obliquus]